MQDSEEDFDIDGNLHLHRLKEKLGVDQLAVEKAILNPGEIAHIPPGYMVFTEAINPSVFIDVLSPSREQILLWEAMMTPVPMVKLENKNSDSFTMDEKMVFTQV